MQNRIDMLEMKNKELVKIMNDQERLFKDTENNYKNYINNLLKSQACNAIKKYD